MDPQKELKKNSESGISMNLKSQAEKMNAKMKSLENSMHSNKENQKNQSANKNMPRKLVPIINQKKELPKNTETQLDSISQFENGSCADKLTSKIYCFSCFKFIENEEIVKHLLMKNRAFCSKICLKTEFENCYKSCSKCRKVCEFSICYYLAGRVFCSEICVEEMEIAKIDLGNLDAMVEEMLYGDISEKEKNELLEIEEKKDEWEVDLNWNSLEGEHC